MSSYQDSFTVEYLPQRKSWPKFIFDLPELNYPSKLNCVDVLLDQAVHEGYGDKIALYSDAGNSTYGELLANSNRIANVLKKQLNVVPGNRVLLRGYNSIELVAAWFAVLKVGAVAVTTMPLLRAAELQAIAKKAKVDHVLCDFNLIEEVDLASAQSGLLGKCLTWGNGELESAMSKSDSKFENLQTAEDDVCLLAFTSGSTGTPKATMHFHKDVLSVTEVVGKYLLETSIDDRYIGSPPLGFTFGLGALVLFPMRFRAASILLPQPSAPNILDAIEKYSATCLFTAPTMYRVLADNLEAIQIGSLQKCVSAGEPLYKEVFKLWKERSGITLIDGIGATELLHIFIGARSEEMRAGATGKPLPGYKAKVINDTGGEVATGEVGRLAVQGPTGCRYLDAQEIQDEYVMDGWNITGDLYKTDSDGYFWFVSRQDDLIISSGYNIAASEVEAALIQHPKVNECAVVGIKDEKRGQLVKAFVVIANNCSASESLIKELADFVKARIAPYKYPRAIEFVRSLPKTTTGKIQRKKLLE